MTRSLTYDWHYALHTIVNELPGGQTDNDVYDAEELVEEDEDGEEAHSNDWETTFDMLCHLIEEIEECSDFCAEKQLAEVVYKMMLAKKSKASP